MTPTRLSITVNQKGHDRYFVALSTTSIPSNQLELRGGRRSQRTLIVVKWSYLGDANIPKVITRPLVEALYEETQSPPLFRPPLASVRVELSGFTSSPIPLCFLFSLIRLENVGARI